MKILQGDRRSGKTTKAIDCAYLTDSLMVVPTHAALELANSQADEYLSKTYGVNKGEINVTCIGDVLKGAYRGKSVNGVVIDELDWTIRSALQHGGINANVLLATRTSDGCDSRFTPQNKNGIHPDALMIRGRLFNDQESFEWLAEAVKEKMERERYIVQRSTTFKTYI